MLINKIVELLSSPLDLSPVAYPSIPELRDQGCRNDFLLVSGAQVEEEDSGHASQQYQRNHIRPEVKIVHGVSNGRATRRIQGSAVIRVVGIDFA